MSRPDAETIHELRKAHRNALQNCLRAEHDRLAAYLVLTAIACDKLSTSQQLRDKAAGGLPLSGMPPVDQSHQFWSELKETKRRLKAMETCQ